MYLLCLSPHSVVQTCLPFHLLEEGEEGEWKSTKWWEEEVGTNHCGG